jgi:hypothetical protein
MDSDSPNASNDLATKIRDDPLFMIKKKENEKKKELLKNPVRMKQLQQMLKADLGKKGKKDKKDKKKKKEKMRRHSSDEDSRKSKHRYGIRRLTIPYPFFQYLTWFLLQINGEMLVHTS